MNCHGECNICESGWLCGRGPKEEGISHCGIVWKQAANYCGICVKPLKEKYIEVSPNEKSRISHYQSNDT